MRALIYADGRRKRDIYDRCPITLRTRASATPSGIEPGTVRRGGAPVSSACESGGVARFPQAWVRTLPGSGDRRLRPPGVSPLPAGRPPRDRHPRLRLRQGTMRRIQPLPRRQPGLPIPGSGRLAGAWLAPDPRLCPSEPPPKDDRGWGYSPTHLWAAGPRRSAAGPEGSRRQRGPRKHAPSAVG